jgi:hypothetical protein
MEKERRGVVGVVDCRLTCAETRNTNENDGGANCHIR